MLARVRTPFSPARERERERERCRICPELLFLFLKGMTGALAPFSYPVRNIRLGYKENTVFSLFGVALTFPLLLFN
jgi:hypothetical protein